MKIQWMNLFGYGTLQQMIYLVHKLNHGEVNSLAANSWRGYLWILMLHGKGLYAYNRLLILNCCQFDAIMRCKAIDAQYHRGHCIINISILHMNFCTVFHCKKISGCNVTNMVRTELLRLYISILKCDWFVKTVPKGTFCISRNTNLKYWSHCGSLVLQCSHARFTV